MRMIVVLAAMAVLAGCSNPMDRVTKLSDVALAEEPTAVDLAEPASEAAAEARGGLFARLLAPKSNEVTDTAIDGAVAEAVATPATDAPTTVAAEAEAAQAPAELVEPEKRRGLFGGLFAGRAAPDRGASVQLAALGPDAAAITSDAAPQALAEPKLRDRAKPRREARIDPDAPDAQLVAPGTALPYGALARVCDMPRGAMGREIAKYPDRSPKYRMFDSAPGTVAPHTFYLTGFPDGCARQFTAALAMFGSPSMYETLRFGAPAKSMKISETDAAYDKVKGKVCGVGRNKPCGARLDKLERDTVFVTMYETFAGSARWANLLVHDGEVLARDVKSGG